MIISYIRKEIGYFKKLHSDAQRLVLSFFLYGVGTPLVSTFINAFIWKNSHDFMSVVLYNIGNWVMLPAIFFINGYLLQFIKMPFLFGAGLFLTALAPFILIMFSVNGYWSIFAIGALFGIGYGLYWANRNFYILRATKSEDRNYFFSLTFAIDTLTNMITPFVIGWFIVFGQQFAYQILALALFFFYILAGIVVLPLTISPSEHSHGLLKNPKRKWKLIRFTTTGFCLQSGINYTLPSLIVLTLLGNEGILGTVSSLGSLLSAIVLYQIGKVALVHHRLHIFTVGVIILVMGALSFTFFPYGLGVIAYVVGTSISSNFNWIAYDSIVMDVVDEHTAFEKHNRYQYIFDNEVYINIGRIIGVGVFFIFYSLTSQMEALRFTPIFIAVTQIGALYLVRQIVVHKE